jgi:hypothetical protein
MAKDKARLWGFVVREDSEPPPPPEPAPPRAWLVADLQIDDETGQPMMEGVYSNYNDDIVVEVDSGTLAGRSSAGRGPVERVSVEAPITLVDQKLGFPMPPNDGRIYGMKNGVWVRIPSGFSLRFEYNYNNIYVEPPANSRFRMNNANPGLVTKVWLHNSDADAVNVSNLLLMVETGFVIFIQDKADPNKFVRFTSTGPMISKGVYTELPVAYYSHLGAISDNARCIIVVYGGG